MLELEKFDKMQVIKRNRERRITKNLEQCKKELKATAAPPTVSSGTLKSPILMEVAIVSVSSEKDS